MGGWGGGLIHGHLNGQVSVQAALKEGRLGGGGGGGLIHGDLNGQVSVQVTLKKKKKKKKVGGGGVQGFWEVLYMEMQVVFFK